MMKKIFYMIPLALFIVSLTGCNPVKLEESEYKGVRTEAVEPEKVTEEEVEDTIQDTLDQYAEKKEVSRAAKEGDIVNIDYTENGNTETYDIEIGSGNELEEVLVGHKAGDEIKKKKYTIKINSVTEKTLDEYDDDFVKNVLGSNKTAEEYREAVKNAIQENNKNIAEEEEKDEILDQIVEQTEVPDTAYDEKEVKEKIESYRKKNESIIQSVYGQTVSEYAKSIGMTEDEFEQQLETDVKTQIRERWVVEYIAKKEDLNFTKKEYQKKLEESMSAAGYKSESEYFVFYAENEGIDEKDAEDEYKYDLLKERVKDWLLEHAVLS